MILNEDSPLPGVEAREYGSLTDNHGSLYGEEARTAVRGRSVSYLDISTSYDASLLSDTSLQRMRSLSQSINDLKILREKQQERKHEMRDLLDDDFLQDHAKKLEDVRRKIKVLEAKYQSPQRKFDASSLDRKKKQPGLKETNESSVLTEKFSTGEEFRSNGSTQEQNGIIQVRPAVTTRKARRPLTWASEDDFSSETNSLSSFGSNRQRIMRTIPENLDRNRNRYQGDRGNPTHHSTPTQQSRSVPTTNATKWHSMPNLRTGETESRAFMYGEAIPLDPTAKKHYTKFTRKTGFYKLNESQGKSQSRTIKQKFRDFFRRKSSSKSKKNAVEESKS